MSGLGAMFLAMACSDDADVHQPPELKSGVVVRMCQGNCLEHTPHEYKAGYYECVICQNRIYVKTLVPTGQNEDPG